MTEKKQIEIQERAAKLQERMVEMLEAIVDSGWLKPAVAEVPCRSALARCGECLWCRESKNKYYCMRDPRRLAGPHKASKKGVQAAWVHPLVDQGDYCAYAVKCEPEKNE